MRRSLVGDRKQAASTRAPPAPRDPHAALLGLVQAIGNRQAGLVLGRQHVADAEPAEATLEAQLAEHDEAVAEARTQLVSELVPVAGPLVGRTDEVGGKPVPEHISGVLTTRLIKG